MMQIRLKSRSILWCLGFTSLLIGTVSCKQPSNAPVIDDSGTSTKSSADAAEREKTQREIDELRQRLAAAERARQEEEANKTKTEEPEVSSSREIPFSSMFSASALELTKEVERLGRTEFREILQSNNSFEYDSETSSSDEASWKCMNSVTVKSKNDYIYWDDVVVDKTCMDSSADMDSFRLRSKGYVQCEKSDTSVLDGKKLVEIAPDGPDQVCKGRSGKYIIEMSVTFGQSVIGGRMLADSKFSMKGPDNGACKFTVADQVTSFDTCVTINSTKWSSEIPDLNRTDWTRITTNSLKAGNNDRFYSSGSVDFVINDWTGTVSYSGPEVFPDYTATDGSTKDSGKIQ